MSSSTIGRFIGIWETSAPCTPVDENRQQFYGGKLTLPEYRMIACADFIENEEHAFDPVLVRLGIGNHELIGKTAVEDLSTFSYCLDQPDAGAQRLTEFPDGALHTYYHWKEPPDLPADVLTQHKFRTKIWGCILATIAPSGEIEFGFIDLDLNDVPAAVKNRYADFAQSSCEQGNFDPASTIPLDSCNEQ